MNCVNIICQSTDNQLTDERENPALEILPSGIPTEKKKKEIIVLTPDRVMVLVSFTICL